MFATRNNSIDCIKRDQRDRSLVSLKVEAELMRIDEDAGHEYIPMDVFVDSGTMKDHFQLSSIRARLASAKRYN